MSSVAAEVAYLSRALKAPRVPEAARVLAERARDESWDYEAYLAAVLSKEVSSREMHGGQARVKRARFPQVKTLDDFDFTFQRSVKRTQIAHLAQLDFLAEAKNVVFLGPPGTGKTHCRLRWAYRPRVVVTGSRSRPHTSGSCASAKPSGPVVSTTSSSASDARLW